LLLGLAAVFAVGIVAALVGKSEPVISIFIVSTAAPAVFLWFANLKFEDLFVFQEIPLFDPKLMFPEQFENEFDSLISAEKLKRKRVVIAIDDLDRCDAKTVQDILVSLKNFLGHSQCYFVVPCDDKAIVKVFTEPNQQGGYLNDLWEYQP
jgi:hypothetical protein